MISANHFSKFKKENMAHKIWLLAVSIILYGTFTVGALTTMPTIPFLSDTSYGSANVSIIYITSFLAILSAFQSYSYLFNSAKTDFYMGLPINKKKVFFANYLNGFFCFFIPFFISFLIFTIYTNTIKGIPWERLLPYCVWFLIITILGFLVIYHITIISIYITGCFFTCIPLLVFFFLVYKMISRSILIPFYKSFYNTFYQNHILNKLENYLSPFSLYEYMAGTELYLDIEEHAYVIQVDAIIFSLLFIFLSFLLLCILQNKRSAEVSEKAFTFKKSIPFLKWLIVICCSLSIGGFFSLLFVGLKSYLFGVAVTILMIIILHICMECIIQLRISHIAVKKSEIITQALCSFAFITTIFITADLYNSYTPSKPSIRKVGVYIDNIDKTYSPNFFSANDYLKEGRLETCILTKDNAKTILNYLQTWRSYDLDQSYTTGTFAFYMDNGNIIYRQYGLSKEAILDFDNIYKSTEYKKEIAPITAIHSAKGKEIYWTNGIDDLQLALDDNEKEQLLDIYRNEILSIGILNLQKETTLGELTIQDIRNEYTGFIYPSCKKTISFLQTQGIMASKKIMDYNINQLTIETYEDNSNRKQVVTSHSVITDQEEIKKYSRSLFPIAFYNQPLLYPIDTNTIVTVQIKFEESNSIMEVECFFQTPEK